MKPAVQPSIDMWLNKIFKLDEPKPQKAVETMTVKRKEITMEDFITFEETSPTVRKTAVKPSGSDIKEVSAVYHHKETPIPLPTILNEPIEYTMEPKPLASIPLSQLYSPNDELCPVCGVKMPPETVGLIVRNPDGFQCCRKCVNKRIGE